MAASNHMVRCKAGYNTTQEGGSKKLNRNQDYSEPHIPLHTPSHLPSVEGDLNGYVSWMVTFLDVVNCEYIVALNVEMFFQEEFAI